MKGYSKGNHPSTGGHGFAKLADEYAYESMGAISADAIASTRVNEPYGWWKNVDFTPDGVELPIHAPGWPED